MEEIFTFSADFTEAPIDLQSRDPLSLLIRVEYPHEDIQNLALLEALQDLTLTPLVQLQNLLLRL